MKTLNIRKGKHFTGKAKVFDKEIYIDTNDGAGFHEVFQEMEELIEMLSKGHLGPGFERMWDIEDMKQDVSLSMLEAIVKYNPDSGKLSTFLWAVGRNKAIDNYRKAAIIRGRIKYLDYIEKAMPYTYDPGIKIEVLQRSESWGDKWKTIMLRIFINGDQISEVAKDEGFTPWGLTRAVRRKLKEARKV